MRCSRCGAALQQGMVICPDCGARQRRQASAVRCANCHGRVAIELTVCPHCGRDLRPAGPRWGFWLASVAVVGLLGLWGLGKLPVERVSQEVMDTRSKLARLAEISELAVSASLPANGQATRPTRTPESVVQGAVETQMFTGEASDIRLETGEGSVLDTPAVEVAGEAVATTQESEAGSGTVEPQVSPTADTGQYYAVQKGDTLAGIGARLGMDWTLIAEANGIGPNAVLQIGQRLRLPLPTATPTLTPTAGATSAATSTATQTALATATATATQTPTPRSGTGTTATATRRMSAPSATKPAATSAVPTKGAPTPTAKAPATPAVAATTYRVKAGDSLAVIGALFGVPWQTIASANNITAATRLQVGQQLIIPASGATGQPPATPRPGPTATATPAPTPARPVLPAPALDSPSDGTPFQGEDAYIELKWLPIPGMPSDARYQVSIQYTENGIVQVYDQLLTPSAGIRFPTWLYGKADQPTGRKYTWSVTAVQPTTDGQGGQLNIPLSASSSPRTLYWN